MGWSQGNDVYIGRAYKTDISDLDIYVKGQHVQWGSHPTPGYNPAESCIHMPKVMCAGMSTAELFYHIAIKKWLNYSKNKSNSWKHTTYKRSKNKTIYTISFHLYKVQKQAKLSQSITASK